MSVDLGRFTDAQDAGGTYASALTELRRGSKTSHWMWFVFPQIAGLGRSSTAVFYALASVDEARAYLAHPVLGPRLHDCVDALLAVEGRTAEQILGGIDAIKLGSSMTLFARADPSDAAFPAVLERYFDGEADAATEALI
ncbi:DUF1810 domain-containing protein [Nakamurella flavida]|uniref:DUF1810 domain-containing protein n=1 Tax=Nakamurella flavida TaxID=363630 RepID=A0A938YRG5_9ACTN|nr:DUF1810 domain-containing protein [Nakamurella flavida]MBM9478099.1 DUF1810 domain-containing protein [Nakamurella flavida]MDP9778680.1 uncharacterized protein (DUF1810 family) [Nakamurella flavida]